MSKTQDIEIIKDFKFAHRGCDVVEYKAGAVVPADDELTKIATDNKWAKVAAKAKKAASENKDAGPAPENKAE